LDAAHAPAKSKTDSAESLVLITLPMVANSNQASKPSNTGGDGAEQARLFGIYTGQIQAQIDRVWRRPRTPVNGATTLWVEWRPSLRL
jgi:hypothetical protein